MAQIKRISKMEENLDYAEAAISELRSALEKYRGAQDRIRELIGYYGGDWMRDHEADEAGLLPHDLKRGVLSEDAVFDLMIENRELLNEMKEFAENAINKLP